MEVYGLREARCSFKGKTKYRKRGQDWVLRASIPDESEGMLSLSVRWNILADHGESDLGVTNLPPGWTRRLQPGKGAYKGQIEAKGLVARVEQARCSLPSLPESESLRFCIEGGHVSAYR